MRFNIYTVFKIIVLLVLLGIVAYQLFKGEEGAENTTLLRHIFRIVRHL